jgi:hypothetical protein
MNEEPANDNEYQFSTAQNIVITILLLPLGWGAVEYSYWLLSFGWLIAVPTAAISTWLFVKLVGPALDLFVPNFVWRWLSLL